MIAGLGVDIIEIARFARAENPHFINRCFTPGEQDYMRGKGPQTAAGLFAAKEAVVKALGTGFCGFWPCAVEILHDAQGQPYVQLHGEAACVMKNRHITRITVSIAHHQTTAVAVAAAESIEGTMNHAHRNRGTNARRRSRRHS